MPPRGSRATALAERRSLRRVTALLIGDDERRDAHAGLLAARIAAADPEALLAVWIEQRVVVLAVEAAAELGCRNAAWDETAASYRQLASRRAMLHELMTIQVIGMLRGADIPAIALKGPTLATRLHGSPARRDPSADIDLLVPTARLFDASTVLVGGGWSPAADALLANGLPDYHLEHPHPGSAPNVELHWRIQWYDDAQAAGLLERAVTVDSVAAPSDADLLAVLLSVWARDGFHGLRIAADIAGWWRRYGGAHPDVLDRLCADPVLGRVYRTAAHAAAAVVGTPAPQRMPDDRLARLAIAIARTDEPRSRRAGTLSQRALVDALVAPEGQRRARLSSHWLLPREMSRVAHPWAPAPLVPLLRVASAARTSRDALPIAARAAARGRGPAAS